MNRNQVLEAQKPSGVIFDFDGVVVDSLSVHLDAWRISYQNLYGKPLTDTVGLAGRSTAAIADILAHRAGKPATKDHLADLKREVLRQRHHKIDLLPGAGEAFQFLRQTNLPFGIASNAPRAFIASTLESHGIQVDNFFGIDDVARPKPEPDVFLKCAKAMGVSVLDHPHILVFEDSPHGLRAAIRAGMFGIGVLTQNTASEMLAVGAKATCLHILEALNQGWFDQIPTSTQNIR
jgi:beta-phosphoglucomutase